mgnify:CR=1 FL=1
MKSILLIEDHDRLAEILSRKFREYDVRIAANGLEGLNLIEERTPDLIITDLNMPLMDGVTFIKNCKATMKIIVLTNCPDMLGVKKLKRDITLMIKNEVDLQDVCQMVRSLI